MSAISHLNTRWLMISAGLLLLALLLAPKTALAQPPAPHQYITEYVGPATCATCHGSFWQCMDTLRERHILESLWQSGNAPWAVWEKS